MFAWVLRFAFFGLGDTGDGVWLLVLSCIVYGVAFDFFNVSGGLFVDKETDPSIRSSAQGLFMIMTNGIGLPSAFIAGKYVVNRLALADGLTPLQQLEGWQGSWYIFAAYALVVALLFHIHLPRLEGESDQTRHNRSRGLSSPVNRIMIQFFAPDIASTQMLPEEEARHAIKVLRSHPGDILTIVDGRGMRYTCRLLSDNPRHADIEIISTEHQPPVWHTDITLAVAPTKNADRMEWLIEKVVEIGVNRIVPLLCRHSERKVMKTDRLERIAVSAMKQSLKATLPVIGPLTPHRRVYRGRGSRQPVHMLLRRLYRAGAAGKGLYSAGTQRYGAYRP